MPILSAQEDAGADHCDHAGSAFGIRAGRLRLQQEDPHFRDNVLFYEFSHGAGRAARPTPRRPLLAGMPDRSA
jgi:hypothetical protein